MAVVEPHGGRAKPKVSTEIDLERGIEMTTQEEAGGGVDIGGIKAVANVCFMVMLGIFVGAATVIFMMPVLRAVELTAFIGGMMFAASLFVLAFRDDYIEKCILENGRAPN